jgi:Flp pilus assembly CpaF family ATPase
MLLEQETECRQPQLLLGWKTFGIKSNDINKTLKSGSNYSIVELRGNEKVYVLEDFPELSGMEARLIAEVVDKFVADEAKTGAFEGIEKALDRFCIENNMGIDTEQRKYILYIINMSVSGFGFISSILSNDNIEEIAIIGLGKGKPVFAYEKNFGWLKTNSFFTDETVVKNLVNKMASQLGRHITLHKPRLNAVLPDGSRLSASFPPISFEPVVTLRKFREKPFTPAELIANNTISSQAMAFLWMAMQTDCSILIAGNTGSGKTTLLNALFAFVPENERVVITEETPEISVPHKHIAKVHVVENLGIGMSDLIVDTLRMRPDRVVIGEVRNNEEVAAFMDTLLAGQGKGSSFQVTSI